MDFTLTIAGVEKFLKAGTLNISMTANGRDTATFVITSEDRSYRPALDAAVIIEEDGTRIFGGFVNGVLERGTAGGANPAIDTEVTAVDFNAYAELRYVAETLAAGTLKSQLTTLVTNYLDDYGVTLHASQVDGPTMPELEYDYVRLDDVLNELSTITADAGQPYVWAIDDFKVLRMYQPSTVPAPFDLAVVDGEVAEVIGDIEVEITREHYANRIIVKVPPKSEESRVESFTGDGSEDTFELQYTLTKHYGYVTDNTGTSPVTNATLTTIEFQGTASWTYDPATNSLIREIGALPNGQVAEIKFDGTFEGVGIAEDAAEIAAHGIWEKVIVVENVPSDETAQSIAEGYLAHAKQLTTKVRYKTLQLGVTPGQEQSATVAPRNLSITAPITDVSLRDYGARNILREVTLIANADTNLARGFRGDYQEWWGDKAGGGPTLGQGGAASVGAAPPDKAVQFNRTGVFGGDADFLYYDTENSIVCGDDSSITAADFAHCLIVGQYCEIADPS